MSEPTFPTSSPDSAELATLKRTLEGAFSKRNWDYVKKLATDILIKKGHHDAEVLEKFLTACFESSSGSDGVRGAVVSKVQGVLGGTFDFQKNIEGLSAHVKQSDFIERFFVGIQSDAMLAPIYLSRIADWVYAHRAIYSTGGLTKILAGYFSRQDAQTEDLQKAEVLYGTESKEGRDVAVRISMKKNTNSGGSLKEKDIQGKIEGEAANRQGMTREQLEARLQGLLEEYTKNNKNPAVVKDLARAYEQLEDWENAGQFYQYAYSLSGDTDVALEDKANEMEIKHLEKQLSVTIAGIKMAGHDADNHDEIKALEDQIWNRKIICAQKKVNRNPSDTGGHLDLGKALWGDFQRKKETDITSSLLITAISHIQRALKDAKQENEVRLLLAEIFSFQGLHRIALSHIEEVLKSIQEDMNDLKIKTLYLKGTILIANGKSEEAQKCFEDIYAYDVGFQDISKKVLKSE